MKPYLAYIAVNLKLTWRDRMVVFFNYLFPLVFFFTFAQISSAEQGGAINWVFSSVLVIGVLGNGFFGGGIRAVVEREANILRRFKVAPITPGPILVSAIVVGLVNFLPSALMLFAISYFRYGMAVPRHWISALLLIVIGTIAFRAMGQIIASVANSMAESQIIIQSLYFPMLFLSGATFPISMLPNWVQILTQFIPATYLFGAMQNILVRNESLADNWQAVGALLLTTCLCTFISMKLFRWEKEEKLKPSAKLWILAVLAPFFLIGAWQAYSRDNISKSQAVTRDLRRSRTLLIRDARVFTGAGPILESASILIRDGKIAKIYTGKPPDAKDLRAEPLEASGKTVLPGLVDSYVKLDGPSVDRALAAYLYSGVTSIGVEGGLQSARGLSPDKLGADVFASDLPEQSFRMAEKGTLYAPLLTRKEITTDPAWLDDTLVQQIGPPELLAAIKKKIADHSVPVSGLKGAYENLRRAHAAGVKLIAASGADGVLVPHGAALHRELQLWVKTGIPAKVALECATRRNPIHEGSEATLLIVNGNPLADIATTEAISNVIFKGERISRTELLSQKD